MELKYRKTLTNCVCREVLLYKDGEEIGHFTIQGLSIDGECFDRSTCSMSIYVDERFQHMGLSKTMMRYMLEKIKVSKEQLLFIDTDASNGFWKHIGMRENRHYESTREVIGKGYEKVITVGELQQFLK